MSNCCQLINSQAWLEKITPSLDRSSIKMFEVRMILRKQCWNALTFDKLWNRESNSIEVTEDDKDDIII